MTTGQLEQNEAAGGPKRRELCLQDGTIVTASVAARRFAQVPNHCYAYLQFKTGGKTVTKYIGKVSAETRIDSIRHGWDLVHSRNLVEKYGWVWVQNTSSNNCV